MIHDLCFMIFLVLCAAVIPGGGGGGGGSSGPFGGGGGGGGSSGSFGGGGGGGGGPCGLPERNLKTIASHLSLYIHTHICLSPAE